MNDEEKDVYIKAKIKNEYIPERIDNLFNNSAKIIENKGEEQMEENFNMNQNQNNQNKLEKKKMPVALKRVLATAACLTVVLGGGNIYASTQGYDNIFFLIKHIVTGKDVRGKENILSDRDITISYRPIEISKGTQIQVNSLVIKDNEAKLKIQVNESDAEKVVTPLMYKVKDENENQLCTYTSNNTKSSEEKSQYKEELRLEGFKNDTKKLILEIYDLDNKKIVELEINLETKEINVIGNAEEVTKISEEELKQYLSAFAMLAYKSTDYKDFSKDTIEVENARKMLAALQIAKINNIDVYTGEKFENDKDTTLVIDREKMNNIISSFTKIDVNETGVIELNGAGDHMFFASYINGKEQYFNSSYEVKFAPTCLDVTDISYVNGIYNVTFKFCYSTEENKGFGNTETVEDLPIYEMSIGLILDEDNEYSKYRVSTMSEVKLLNKPDDYKDLENSSVSDIEIKNVIQGFFNIISQHEASTTNMLTIEEIALAAQEDLTQIYNTAERDNEEYMKTDIKYLDLKNKMLEYMTEGLFETYSYGYKNVDGNLWIRDMGASGYKMKVETLKKIASNENVIIYEVNFTTEAFDGREPNGNEKIELTKNKNGKYVVSARGYELEIKELLQNYLELSISKTSASISMLEKLNLVDEIEYTYIDEAMCHAKTNVEYSKYKEKMLNYVTQNWLDERFGKFYYEKDGLLYCLFDGGTTGEKDVKSISWIKERNTYIAEIYVTDLTAAEAEQKPVLKTIEFTVKYSNDKYVIDYCEY